MQGFSRALTRAKKRFVIPTNGRNLLLAGFSFHTVPAP